MCSLSSRRRALIERIPRRHVYRSPEEHDSGVNDHGQLTNSLVVDEYVERIATAWQNAVDSIIETGRLLIQAKGELKHGEWGKLFQDRRLPFSQRMANDLMKIARDPVLSNPAIHCEFATFLENAARYCRPWCSARGG